MKKEPIAHATMCNGLAFCPESKLPQRLVTGLLAHPFSPAPSHPLDGGQWLRAGSYTGLQLQEKPGIRTRFPFNPVRYAGIISGAKVVH